VRVGWFGAITVLPGERQPISLGNDVPDTAEARRQFAIFHWFTDGFAGPIAGEPRATGDMRITSGIAGFEPLWGLDFRAPRPDGGARRWSTELGSDRVGELWRQIRGQDPAFLPVAEAVKQVAVPR
jgi:hypothetical protein